MVEYRVGNAWQDRSTGSSIALQFVGDDPEWLLALTAQQSAKEPLGCTLVAARRQPQLLVRDDASRLVDGFTLFSTTLELFVSS
jgi:hypothetical protein